MDSILWWGADPGRPFGRDLVALSDCLTIPLFGPM